MRNRSGTIIFLFAPLIGLFKAIGFIINKVYKAGFAWWIDDALEKRDKAKFECDIRDALPFLFLQYGAKFVANDRAYPKSFDYVVLIVEALNLRLRFIRGRGELRVDVSSSFLPSDWHDLSLVLDEINSADDQISKKYSYIFLSDISRLLQCDFERLNDLFSSSNYPKLKSHLAEIDAHHHVVTKQVQASINMRSSR